MRIRSPTTTPPGLWHYRTPFGVRVPDPAVLGANGFYAYNDLEAAVLAAYKANGIPPPAGRDLRDAITEQMCQRLPPGWCIEDGRPVGGHLWNQLRQTVADIAEGTQLLVDLMTSADAWAEPEVAAGRAAICAVCPYNGPEVGCTGCTGTAMQGARAAMRALLGRRRTPLDNKLQACYLCGCELRVKVWASPALLARRLRPTQLALFPKAGATGTSRDFPGCWVHVGPGSVPMPPT